MTVHEWLQSAKSRLNEAGLESPDLEAQLLAAHVLRVERHWLMAHPDEAFPDLAGESLIARRLDREPLAYILGWREFWNERYRVGPGVLIPRQETEVLVEATLRRAWSLSDRQPRVLDLGTGSGCIAISIKRDAHFLRVSASDISAAALDIAAQNATDLGVDVSFVKSDGFEAFRFDRFELIVTNPPYIGFDEPLARELVDYEPHQALFAGPSGLEFYQRLSKEAASHLEPEGLLLMEVGYMQAQMVSDLFCSAGWQVVEKVKDLTGIDRVIVCTP